MTGEGRFDGDGRGIAIANLANHQDLRILPQDTAQAASKIKLGALPGLSLGDALDDLLNRIFNGYYVLPAMPGLYQMPQAGVNRGSLAAPAGPGKQDRAGAFAEQTEKPLQEI